MPDSGPSAPDLSAAAPHILLDESVPHDLGPLLIGHRVATVQGQGWAGMKNGALLRAARAAGFHVLITVDRRMEFQQNIPQSGLALVVLRAASTRVADLVPLVVPLMAALGDVRAGTVTHVQAS